MNERLPQQMDPDEAVFTISVAAALADMHPQTLRTYDRQGLVVPRRTKGGGRRYSPRDVQRLRLVQYLSQVEGINLVGVQRILALQTELDEMRARTEELTELMRRLTAQHESGPRVFSASQTGYVAQGRGARTPRALPSGR